MKVSMIRARTAALALALATSALPAPAQLPTLGDGTDLSPAAERRIGERIARELFRDPDFIDDPVVAEYVQSLWQPLLEAARLRGELPPELDQRFAWQVLLGKDRSINAFAVPGGWLGVHLGLVAATASRDELASVLAHELSHVTQRHIARMVTQERRQAPLAIAALVLGTLAAAKSPDAANAMIAGSQALTLQNQLRFSRDMEREADRVGLGVMSQAGFQPQGFASMFEKLQQASRLNDTGATPYLRTHPMTTERLADMRSRLPPGASQAAPAGDAEQGLVSARARALSAAGVDALRALVREAEAGGAPSAAHRRAPALYAGALAASRLREPAVAARLLARLEPAAAGDARAARQARLLAAELALARGEPAGVEAALGPERPTARPELLLKSQAALRAGRPALAVEALQPWVAVQPQDGTAWQLLSQAYTALDQPLRAVRADAEARMAWLDYGAALDRLRAGQQLARQGTADHIEASIIDARAREVASLLREQALER